tara:strand:- start:821 stop:1603 length:783 start_codon:yes stop_codon:yes gene_type:complete
MMQKIIITLIDPTGCQPPALARWPKMPLLKLVTILVCVTGSQSISTPPLVQGVVVQSRRASELRVVPRQMGRPMRLLNQALRKSPTATNMLFAAWIFAVGDSLAQVAIERADARDWARTGHSALLGFTWAGYCSPQIYRLADALFPGTTPLKIGLKVCTTSGILATSGNYVNMLGRRLLAGAPLGDAVAAVHRDFWEVVRADVAVWPAYDAVCFATIPVHLRGVTTATVNCLWSAYISTVASGDRNAHAGPHSQAVGAAA